HTPMSARIEVVTRGDVRRAKLYYLRDLRGKAAKIKEKRESVPAGKGKGRAAAASSSPGAADSNAAGAAGATAGGGPRDVRRARRRAPLPSGVRVTSGEPGTQPAPGSPVADEGPDLQQEPVGRAARRPPTG